MDSNPSSLKTELTQLNESRGTGNLSDAATEDARVVTPAASSSMNLWLALAAVVLAASGVAYWWTGSPPLPTVTSTAPPSPWPTVLAAAPEGAHDTGADQMDSLVDRLALKLKDKPQDVEGWSMLARSYAVLERHAEAVAAFEHALALRPNDPALMAGHAASMAKKSQGGQGSKSASTQGTVSGTVSLAAAMTKLAGPDDTVFIFARAAQGERVPLAVLRKQVKDLPLQFTLDDSMGISPQNRLSGAAQVVVSARISKSGQAMAQTGDIVGQAAPVAVGASGLAVEIRELVK